MSFNHELSEQLKLTLVTSSHEAAPRKIIELADLAFAGGVTALQLREKNISDQAFYSEAKELSAFCRERGKLFIINDRLDIALAVDASGLHLGQTDLPAEVAASILPKNKILGISASSFGIASAARQAGADYLGVGAIFPTGSKDDASVIKTAEARRIIDLGLPTVAIGGINADNADEVWKIGFTGLAVISALSGARHPSQIAADLLRAANSKEL